MSEVVAYEGKLIPIDLDGKSLDEWIMKKLDRTNLGFYENWLEALEEESYKDEDRFHYDENSKILYKIETEDLDSQNLMKMSKNSDGTYDFIASFYNGATYLGEVIQEGLDSVREQEIKNGIGVQYLLFNGYIVGDRILEDVYFKVSLKIEGLDAKIIEIFPDESAYPYIENIRWENYVDQIRIEVQRNIDYLKNFYKDDNTTFEKEFEKYKEETGEENGPDMIMDV